ncbi:helix-turn-helix domain-containing protein [Streptomyces sp. NPDC001652]|uniref:helix-turn-helix domain-containing protein n=1 Tax=Streptomyces sp. NPDC001652 TaxID=3154393 RepID=UPI003324A87E
MTWPRGHRLALAADLLREPDTTHAVVADRVGCVNAFAFSNAFENEHGISPSEYRTRGTRSASRDSPSLPGWADPASGLYQKPVRDLFRRHGVRGMLTARHRLEHRSHP